MLKPGDIIRFLSPTDARLDPLSGRDRGKRYRIEADGALLALRDSQGTIRLRYLPAELERLRAAGRIIIDRSD